MRDDIKYVLDKLDEMRVPLDTMDSIMLYHDVNLELQAIRMFNSKYNRNECVEDFIKKFVLENFKVVKATDLAKKMYPNAKVNKNNMLYVKRVF